MRSRTDPARLCERCRLRRDVCLCGLIPQVVTRTRFLVVQHALEACKTTNTGHLATLALTNCALGQHGGATGDLDLEQVDWSGAAVLYPADLQAIPSPLPTTVVVVDGTWHQARRMLQRIPQLRGLPRLSIGTSAHEERLRTPHFEGGLATIEAMAEALRLLEGDRPAEVLHALHRTFMTHIRRTRGGPQPLR